MSHISTDLLASNASLEEFTDDKKAEQLQLLGINQSFFYFPPNAEPQAKIKITTS